MYVYHGHLKLRTGHIKNFGFIPDDNPKIQLCQLPFDDYILGPLPFTPRIVTDKYQYGKVLFEDEKDIPKWKEFFKQLYSDKINNIETGYKKKLWTNLVEELSDERT